MSKRHAVRPRKKKSGTKLQAEILKGTDNFIMNANGKRAQ
jgi:hypothetical protein